MASPDGATRPHLDAPAVRAARLRARLAARRARHVMDDITDTGRVAGRVATRLTPLPREVPLDGPAVALLLLPDARAIAIVDAAAATLHAHDLAAGIGRAARAKADALIGTEARSFALSHRQFSRPPTGQPIGGLIEVARAEVAHLWADRLPAPLCDEFRPAVPRPQAQTAEAPPAAEIAPEPAAVPAETVTPAASPSASRLAQVRATALIAAATARSAAAGATASAGTTAAALATRARRVRTPWAAPRVTLAKGSVMAEPATRADLALDAALAALLPRAGERALP